MSPKKPSHPRQIVRLDLEPVAHQELRLAAARQAMSMAEFARQAVTEAARKVNAKAEK